VESRGERGDLIVGNGGYATVGTLSVHYVSPVLLVFNDDLHLLLSQL